MLTTGHRDRIVRSFKERHYQPGMQLIREGESSALCSAFIIKEGHVALASRVNPANVKFDNEGKIIGTTKKRKAITGYLSQTTTTFQFGLKGKNQWVGEDILILATLDTMYYSATAVGKVVALEISKMDMLQKLPSLLVKNLEKASRRRRDFFSERLSTAKTVVKALVR